MAERKENVVMFPLMAHGHMTPFLALAFQIEKHKGYNVTFVSTPLNVKILRSSIPPNSSVRLAELPFCSTDHGLPPECENTKDLPEDTKSKLIAASLTLKPAFERLVRDLVQHQNGHPPLCIINDVYNGWCADIAHELGVLSAAFLPFSAYSMATIFSAVIGSHASPEYKELLRPHILDRLEENDDRPFSKFLKTVLPQLAKADVNLFNTVEAIDETGMNFFRTQSRRPVWVVGPLVLYNKGVTERLGKENGVSADYIMKWLDAKPSNSVLFISFGSEFTPSGKQMIELAKALEASGKNFIWVVKPPVERDIDSKPENEDQEEYYLPKGFERRVTRQNKGLLVRQWAPQMEILSHKSTGAFLTHCGWNSALEALVEGKPLLSWPINADQFLHSQVLVEGSKACLEVAKGRDCEVNWKDIKEKIELVMGDSKEAMEIKSRANKTKELFEDALRDEENYKGSAVKALNDFFNAAFQMREKNRGVF